MNAIKRSLALLLVIAMMISSFAFAEAEDILVIDQAEAFVLEEASEEAVSETPDEMIIDIEEEPEEDGALQEITLDQLFTESCSHPDWYYNEQWRENAVYPAESITEDTHYVTFDRWGRFFCPDCYYINEELISTGNSVTENHYFKEVWDDESGSYIKQCDCGYSFSCAHENGNTYEGRRNVGATDNGDGTHNAEYQDYTEFYCYDCYETITEYGETYIVENEPHDWHTYKVGDDYHSSCKHCVAMNPCEHEFVYGEIDRSVEYADDNGDGTHTIGYYAQYAETCSNCGAEYYIGYDWDNLITVTEPHRFEYGWCQDCYAELTCDHVNFEEYGEDKRAKEVISSNADTCTFIYDLVAYGRCYDCDRYVEIVRAEDLLAENVPHEWGVYNMDGERYIRCIYCGTESTCDHEWMIENEYRDVISSNDNGDGTHDVTFNAEYYFKCSKCSASYWELLEEPETLEGEEHWFDGLTCRWCDAPNPCDHKNAQQTGDNPYSDAIVHDVDAFTHTITAYKRTWYYCPDCYSEYDVVEKEPHIVNQTLPHEYDNGRCWICDYVNTCKHPNFVYQYEGYQPAWELVDEWLIETTKTTHTFWAVEYREGMCPDCQEYIYDYGTEPVQHTEAHFYYGGNVCNLCEYVPTCKHTNTAVSKRIYMYGGMENNIKLNDELHSATCKLVKVVTCVDCGFESETVEKTYTVLEPHNFYLSNRCDCGYITTCAHKNTYTETWDNPSGKGTSVDSKTHKVTVNNIKATYCEDCGALLSEKVTGSSVETGNHTFGAANICLDCGYVSTCKHSSTTTESYSWNRTEALSLDKHQKLTYTNKSVICKTCKAYLNQRSTTSISFGTAAAHTYKNGVCTACGVSENPGVCKHVWENGVCTKCEEVCQHSYANCVCVICGDENHVVVDCVCTGCGMASHVVENCVCTICNQEIHTTENCVCTACGKEEHAYVNCICTACGKEQHTIENCICTVCGMEAHTFVDDICTVCGAEDLSVKAFSVLGLDENNTLIVGEKMTRQIELEVLPQGAEFEAVYSTSNKKVATVDENGLITGVLAGKTAEITVAPADADSDVAPVTFTVKVLAPTKVTLNATKATMGVGETIELVPAVAPEGAPVSYTATSSNAKVATVVESENGFTVEAVKAGTSTITVKTQNGKKATCVITVKEAPTGISLNAESAELAAGENTTLKATLASKKAYSAITWTSSNEAVAKVENGVVTTLAAGEAIITASTYNGLSAACTVKVWNAVASIEIAESKLMSVSQKFTPEIKLLDAEGNETIGAYTIEGNKTYAPVSGATITAKKATKADVPAIITVKAYNGVEAACAVTVVAAPTKITVTPAKGTLGVGEKMELAVAHVKEEAPTEYSFSNSKPTVASIEKDENGAYIVEALKAGSTTITFKTHNGKKATCKVTVKAAPTGIKLNAEAIELAAGETATLKATIETSKAYSAITWTSSNEAVAKVENGVVTTLAAGEAIITASTYNGLSAACTVKVWNAVASIEIAESKLMSVSQKFTPEIKLLDAEGNETIGAYSVSTGNKSYATVSGATITAKKATKADAPVIITVKAYNGVEAACAVTVVAAPTKITVTPAKATIGVGEKMELAVAHVKAEAPTEYSFSNSKPTVASIEKDENGAYIVEALKAGSTTITFKTHNGKKATCKVTVKAAPTGLVLSATELGLLCGDTAKLSASFKKNEGSSIMNVKIEPEGIVSYENGVLTGISAGTAAVTFETLNNVSATCNVIVSAPLAKIVLMNGETENFNWCQMSGKQSLQLGVKRIDENGNEMLVGDYTFKSSNTKLVTVSKTGKVTVKDPKDIAYVTITVTGYNGVKAELQIFVCPAPTKVNLVNRENWAVTKAATLTAGESISLYADLEPFIKDADLPATLTASSSNSSVAKVELESGDRVFKVTGIAPGTAKITVKTHNGKSATCTVTVKKAEPAASVDLASFMGAEIAPVWSQIAE